VLGLLGEGLDGALGVEKLRLPRLPYEPPPPTLAQALVSKNVEKTKQRAIKSPMATHNRCFVFIFKFALVFKVEGLLKTPDFHGSVTCLNALQLLK
jgi:hypothetical protein